MKNRKIVMLAGRSESTNIVYNSLCEDFPIDKIIIEDPVPKSKFLKTRIRMYGYFKVFGQVLFQLLIAKRLLKKSRNRIQEIKEQEKLNDTPVDPSKRIDVNSANSKDTIEILKKLNPDIVVINGTRIISDKVLNSIPAKFVNMHAGITPLYRGSHGGYWALTQKNIDACGVTVHLVDPGIDTGGILEQGLIIPDEKDNFCTYPLLQLAVGLPLLKKQIVEITENRINVRPNPKGESKLWSHPTIWEYLWYKFTKDVK